MATAAEIRRQLFPQLLGRNYGPEDILAVGGDAELQKRYGDDSVDSQYNEIINSPEFRDYQRKTVENQLRPAYEAGQTQFGLSLSGLDEDTAQVGREYERLARTLKEQAAASQAGFEERQNQLGLLQSGQTGTGIGKIQSDLNRQLGESEQDKTYKLAQLALQRAGINVQKTLATNTYTQNTNDLVGKLMAGASNTGQQLTAERQKAQMEAMKAGAGNTKIESLGGRDVLVDMNTGDILKDYGASKTSSGSRSSGGSAKVPNPGYKLQVNKAGGLGFFDKKGSPLSAYQYLAGFLDEVGLTDIADLLSRSGDVGDKKIVNDINSGVSLEELVKKYPWVFRGA